MQRRSLLKAAIFTAAAGALSACAQTEAPQDIVDIAASNPEFSTLVTAVQAAGLVDTLKSDGPFTVFAPTNARGGKYGTGVRVNDANVTSADIMASNGVIHVIDKVLLPE